MSVLALRAPLRPQVSSLHLIRWMRGVSRKSALKNKKQVPNRRAVTLERDTDGLVGVAATVKLITIWIKL